ncbi:hypothetical protein [Prauserella flavalba]|uniref:Uncharacterized protein n=1 Tax=Prauserella flavalba TaxID=1477506 RepID=A0A318LPB1_9PSEU|nr:hypothetical protein [Prauserella flavalba]PXY36396.1 hypothetical protein BA062_13395 [Prauserella flavalba]
MTYHRPFAILPRLPGASLAVVAGTRPESVLDRLACGLTVAIAGPGDTIVVLRDGSVVEAGPAADLIAADGVYARLRRAWAGAAA